MQINNLQDKFIHGLQDVYDAEHQFLKGQEEMLQNASDPTLKQAITTHIEETRQQISNLAQVFQTLGEKPQREMCDGAKGIVSEGQKMIKAAQSPEIRDTIINGAAAKVEHYEIATYRGLITGAELMGQREVVTLLQRNLEQEESQAQLVEQTEPQLLQKALQSSGQSLQGGQFTQATPTY